MKQSVAFLFLLAAFGAGGGPLHRDTPQSSVTSFLEACHGRDYQRAWKYLDVRNLPADRRFQDGPQLAQQLETILDHDGQFDVGALSQNAEGTREPVGFFNLNGKQVELQLERVTLRSGAAVWVFSADSVGWIPQLARLASDSPLERRLPVLNVDETGSRTNGDKRWVWVLCSSWFVFYHIASNRGVEVLVQLLGKAFAGILCSDRCPTYLSYHRGLVQFCWAHLQRTLKGIGEFASTPDAVHFARDMLSAVGRLFDLWYRFCGEAGSGEGLLTRSELIQQSIPIQKKICRLAAKFLDSETREVRNLATAIYKYWDKLFTFIEQEGVDPPTISARGSCGYSC